MKRTISTQIRDDETEEERSQRLRYRYSYTREERNEIHNAYVKKRYKEDAKYRESMLKKRRERYKKRQQQ